MTAGPGQPGPRVSVLIAAYDAAAFLPRAVASARSQSLAPFEILVVDDASTDDTAPVARDLAADGDVRVITLDRNGGPSAARNAGIEAARGDWIAVLDADDALERDHLATLAAAAGETGADIVLANFVYFDPLAGRPGATGIAAAGGSPFATDAADYVDHCRPLRAESDWGLLKPLFRTAFLRAHGLRYPLDSRHGEDFLLMCRALLAGARVAVSPAPTYRYTHRGIGWSRTRIDYGATIADTRRLAADPRVRRDAALTEALDRRAAALVRWQAQQTADWLIAQRRYAALARHALTDRDVRATLLRRLSPARPT